MSSLQSTKTLVGVRFTRLKVIAKDTIRSTKQPTRYECLCDCSTITSVVAAKLNNGSTKSCGCLRKQRIAKGQNTKHGMRNSTTYSSWANMKTRCTNTDHKSFKHYGERGIAYDTRWESFELFLEDMGVCPDGLTLERIDVNGDYVKSNCKWDIRSVQSHNRRKLPCRSVETYSDMIGVSWNIKRLMWSAKLVRGKEVLFRGMFTSELDAAIAYDNASELHYGDRPNKTRGCL